MVVYKVVYLIAINFADVIFADTNFRELFVVRYFADTNIREFSQFLSTKNNSHNVVGNLIIDLYIKVISLPITFL